MINVLIKRVYEDPSENDGYRILVDRIWPRGISKERAQLNEWVKNIAPSTELRKWFDHQEEKFVEFSKRYKLELLLQKEELKRLSEIAEQQKLTLLYSAKDIRFNQAIVLRDVLIKMQ